MNIGSLHVRVARKTLEALDICTFELVDIDGGALPAFSAGSHIDVQLPNGLTRQYSLCNDPSESHRYLVGVLKDPAARGGSLAMHELVKEGDVLVISTPKSHFALAHDARLSLLLAGGIGVTPILCMAERLAIVGEAFEMHYCTRSLERTAFRDRILRSSFAADVRFHFDDGAVGQKLDIGALLAMPQPSVHVYVCGPKGFMDAVLGAARGAGWPETQLHYEFFSAATGEERGGRKLRKSSSRARAASLSCRRPGRSLQALAEVGLDIATSCEQGVCGTCLTRVLEGEPDHRDLFLTPEEQAANDQFTPCCSRSKSPLLVLDL
jgi:vanillate O-demethylase ferredoxin subunit